MGCAEYKYWIELEKCNIEQNYLCPTMHIKISEREIKLQG